MRKCLVLLVLALVLVSIVQQAPARMRIERWLDVTGDYWEQGDNKRWSGTANGNLNIIMGVRSRINTGVNVTYGMDGESVIATQELRVSGGYVYDASRATSYSLQSTMRTLTPDASTSTGYTTDIYMQTNLTMWKYLSRRFGLTLGLENWIKPADKFTNIFTELQYQQPFGKYLTKANLLQRIFIGARFPMGSNYDVKSTTAFTYDITRRLSFVFEGVYTYSISNSMLTWRYQRANIVYHFY